MKVVFVCLSVYVALAAGAPNILNSIPDYIKDRQDQFRDKRHKIGGIVMPVATTSQVATYMPYQWNMRPYINPYAYSNYGYQSTYGGCGRGFLKADERDDDRDVAEMEQEPSTRRHSSEASSSNPALTPTNLASIGQLVAAPGGPAYGVFPNVPSSSCNVPLLFSCAPSIVPGRIMRGNSQFGYGGFPLGMNGFRDVEGYAYEPHYHEPAVQEGGSSDDTQVNKS